MHLIPLFLVIQASLASDEGILINARGVSRPASVLDQSPAATRTPSATLISPGGGTAPASVLGQALPITSDAARINVDFQGADIHNVLRFFASVSDINVVAADDVSGQVTVRMEAVPWDLALLTILKTHGLGATMMPSSTLPSSTLVIHPLGAQP